MQFVVNVTNQKVICHDNNQLLAFGTRMLPPPGGLLTRLSMVVALVFGKMHVDLWDVTMRSHCSIRTNDFNDDYKKER